VKPLGNIYGLIGFKKSSFFCRLTQWGIDGSRMQTDCMGATHPVAPNTTSTGKAQNRQVEFIKQ